MSCAHFIDIDGAFERLHGHNLTLSAEVEGPGDEGLVMDFRELEELVRVASSRMDHKLLVPARNPHIRVKDNGSYWEIVAASKRYRIPHDDLVLLPIRNSTVEEIGQYLFREISERLPKGLKLNFVSVQEMNGREAIVDSPH